MEEKSKIDLKVRLPPSRRHPEGAPRCQAVTKRHGQPCQCQRVARAGFRVCGSHGAGFLKRELAGVAQNPALAPLTHGNRARPETIEKLLQNKPELRALFEQELESPGLFDFRRELALAKTMTHHYVARANLDDTDTSSGNTPPTITAIGACQRVMEIAERVLKIEATLGPITHEELNEIIQAFVETLIEFVPAERHADASAYLRTRCVRAGRFLAD